MTKTMNTKTRPKMTIAVPVHGMENGPLFLRRLFDSLWNQSFQDFEIVVTDNSDDDELEKVCDWYRTGIRYFKNPRKGMAQNTNEAIKRSTGEVIKILYMDDFMAHNRALEKVWDAFDGQWLVTGCTHTARKDRAVQYWFDNHVPHYNDNIHLGENTIGSPSVLTILNEDPLLFDENMTWLLDCDLYKRCYEKYGEPKILKDINVVIGVGDHQMTHILSENQKLSEHEYITNKYE